MGTSTNAMLLYGYHLGNEDGWEVENVDDCDKIVVDWWNQDDQDFGEAASEYLLAEIAGFTETDWRADGYFDRKREAEKRLDVELESHCSGEYPMWVLCAKRITARRGTAHEIDPARLAAEPAENGWDEKLAAAIEALGIRPTQQKPAWLLCSYWG